MLSSLPSARDKALKHFSRRKIQDSYVGRMLKGKEEGGRGGMGGEDRDVSDN